MGARPLGPGLARAGPGACRTGSRRVVADLRDDASVREAFTRRFDAVCHLAALVQARGSRADPRRVLAAPTSAAPWRFFRRSRRRRGAAAAGRRVDVRGVRRARRCPHHRGRAAGPTNPYGSSKLAADRAVADLAATGAIGAVSLRAFNVAGGLPGHADRDETRLVPKAVAVVQGRAPELVVNGDGGAVRDYVHVADMAEAFVRALDACRPGHWTAYNVGSGRRSTIMDVVAAAEAVAGRVLPVRHDQPAAEPAELLADASRIRRDLGWRPESSDLQRIVADAVAAAE